MVNRVYTEMEAVVHHITQARSQNKMRDKWARGDTGFSPECASRTAGREAGALGTEFTWADWVAGTEWKAHEESPIQGPSHWATLLDSQLQTIYLRQNKYPCPSPSVVILWQAGKLGNDEQGQVWKCSAVRRIPDTGCSNVLSTQCPVRPKCSANVQNLCGVGLWIFRTLCY